LVSVGEDCFSSTDKLYSLDQELSQGFSNYLKLFAVFLAKSCTETEGLPKLIRKNLY